MPQLSLTGPIPELLSTLPMPELSPTISSTVSSKPIPDLHSPVSSDPQQLSSPASPDVNQLPDKSVHSFLEPAQVNESNLEQRIPVPAMETVEPSAEPEFTVVVSRSKRGADFFLDTMGHTYNKEGKSNKKGQQCVQLQCCRMEPFLPRGLNYTSVLPRTAQLRRRTSSPLCIWSHPCERSHTGTPTSRRTSIIAIYAIVDLLYELPEAEKGTKTPKRP